MFSLKGTAHSISVEAPPATVNFTVGTTPSISLPRIGLGVASHHQPLSSKELSRLRALNLSHLRVDLDLSQLDYESGLRQAVNEATELGLSLEVAVTVTDAAQAWRNMAQEKIVDPGASWRTIFQIERIKLMGTTLNSKRRCLIFIDTFRSIAARAVNCVIAGPILSPKHNGMFGECLGVFHS